MQIIRHPDSRTWRYVFCEFYEHRQVSEPDFQIDACTKSLPRVWDRIWIDLEYDSSCNNVSQNTPIAYMSVLMHTVQWNYGASGNLAQAKSLIAAAQASGYAFGIYSSPGEWSTLFGSYSPVLDSSAPLWFATYDDVQSLTLSTPFGGYVAS